MWWFVVPVLGAIIGKIVHDAVTEKPSPIQTCLETSGVFGNQIYLETRGVFGNNNVLVLGRTGAGKSSLINMIKGAFVLEVGDIGSTTRWLEGVSCQTGEHTFTLVDSPGIGEAFTNEDYNQGIVHWFSLHHTSIRCVLLVIQADSKGHADDLRLLQQLAAWSRKPLLIVLNQVDKIKPVRESLSSATWEEARRNGTKKSHHISEKILEISIQFSDYIGIHSIIPVSSEPEHFFNQEVLKQHIKKYMV